MTPVKVFPVWVICQVICSIMADDRPAPIIDPLESDTLPLHVPVIGIGPAELGLIGLPDVEEDPPQPVRVIRLEDKKTNNQGRIGILRVHCASFGTTRARPHSTCQTV